MEAGSLEAGRGRRVMELVISARATGRGGCYIGTLMRPSDMDKVLLWIHKLS